MAMIDDDLRAHCTSAQCREPSSSMERSNARANACIRRRAPGQVIGLLLRRPGRASAVPASHRGNRHETDRLCRHHHAGGSGAGAGDAAIGACARNHRHDAETPLGGYAPPRHRPRRRAPPWCFKEAPPPDVAFPPPAPLAKYPVCNAVNSTSASTPRSQITASERIRRVVSSPFPARSTQPAPGFSYLRYGRLARASFCLERAANSGIRLFAIKHATTKKLERAAFPPKRSPL